MGKFSKANKSSKSLDSKGAKLTPAEQKALETKFATESPYMVLCPQTKSENNKASRLAYKLWKDFVGTVTYVDVHRRSDDEWGDTPQSALVLDETKFKNDYTYRYVKSVNKGFRPQFMTTKNISGKESTKSMADWRVADAIVQKNVSTGELVKVDDWEIVNGDYVASNGCRFEWTNVKAKTGSVMPIANGGSMKVTTLGKRGKVRIDTCNGISVCEFMALNEQGLINQTVIQQVQMASSALETCYVAYTINYKQVRELKDSGTASVDLWGKLKCGESVAVKYKGPHGRPSLEFKSTLFHKSASEPVNLDDVKFGHTPVLLTYKKVTGKLTISDKAITLV